MQANAGQNQGGKRAVLVSFQVSFSPQKPLQFLSDPAIRRDSQKVEGTPPKRRENYQQNLNFLINLTTHLEPLSTFQGLRSPESSYCFEIFAAFPGLHQPLLEELDDGVGVPRVDSDGVHRRF